MFIELFFPTVIGVSDFDKADQIEKQYYPYLQDLKNKYSRNGTFCYYEVHKDPFFKELTNWITGEVNKFSDKFNFTDTYIPVESWFNEYEKNSNQSSHCHPGSVFSAVFYLKGSEDGARFLFRSPLPVDTKNPENNSVKKGNESHLNELSWTSAGYSPKKGRLLMFRSFLQHSTDTVGNELEQRLAIAFTFDKK